MHVILLFAINLIYYRKKVKIGSFQRTSHAAYFSLWIIVEVNPFSKVHHWPRIIDFWLPPACPPCHTQQYIQFIIAASTRSTFFSSSSIMSIVKVNNWWIISEFSSLLFLSVLFLCLLFAFFWSSLALFSHLYTYIPLQPRHSDSDEMIIHWLFSQTKFLTNKFFIGILPTSATRP